MNFVLIGNCHLLIFFQNAIKVLNSLDPYRAWQFNMAQYFVSLIIYVQTVSKGHQPRSRAIIFFPCSAELSTKFILLINVKMPTIAGILTFISMINTTSARLKARNFFICRYFSFYEQLKFRAQLSWAWKKFYNLEVRKKVCHWQAKSCSELTSANSEGSNQHVHYFSLPRNIRQKVSVL